MRAMVVSLTSATLRRAHIDKQFNELNLNYEFFDAVNREDALEVCKELGFIYYEDITLGELGCLLSHITIWQKMIDNNEPYLIVFEDDIVLSKNIHIVLNSLNTIMEQCSILKLETMMYLVKTSEPIMDFNVCQVNQLQSNHMGTAGYVITLNLAKKIINSLINEPIIKPIDHYLFDDLAIQSSIVFQLEPALAIQDDVLNKDEPRIASDLENERHYRLYGTHPKPNIKQKLTFIQKFNREINRALYQVNPINWQKQWKESQMKKSKKIIGFE